MAGETVEKKLYNAASKGDVATLKKLLQEDPYLVETVSFAFSRNVVHIATLRGQVAIVEEVLNINPQLARNLDSQQSSPLHIAAAQGNVEIVKKLLSVVPEACWRRDCDDMNPVHIAAMNGHIDILEELLQESHLPAMERLHRGQTVFHLCVKHGQLTTLKVLVEKLGDLVYAKDDDGETLLHLAVRSNQLEIVKYLVEDDKITKQQTPNSMGKTELEIFLDSPIPPNICDYFEMLKIWKKLPDRSKWEPVKLTDNAMVVLILIASMAFQAIISPPGGYWQDSQDNNDGHKDKGEHKAGKTILESTDPDRHNCFLVFNTLAFVLSLSTIFLIMTGLPSRKFFYFNLAMDGMSFSIVFIVFSYGVSLKGTNSGTISYLTMLLSFTIFIFGAVTASYVRRRGIKHLDRD